MPEEGPGDLAGVPVDNERRVVDDGTVAKGKFHACHLREPQRRRKGKGARRKKRKTPVDRPGVSRPDLSGPF
jgi:hypothetical protein